MIKAVIFDMDGLLIDSEPFWREAEKGALEKIGIPVKKEITSETMGVRIDALVEYWFKRYPWSGPSKKEVELDIIRRVILMIKREGELMPGAREVLETFRKMDMPMAIASSSPIDIINSVLERTLIAPYIRVVHSAQDELFGKPDPAVYIGASKKLGISAGSCVAFEDSPNGVISAKSAGMRCVAVPSAGVEGDSAMEKADLVIDSLLDFDERSIMNFN
ncbi:MAG: hexitol phosphatase HxpB [Candidatus Paceibacterota bacterium]|jgi:sugar-phosphatase